MSSFLNFMALLVRFSSKGREFHAVELETANECSVNLSLVRQMFLFCFSLFSLFVFLGVLGRRGRRKVELKILKNEITV